MGRGQSQMVASFALLASALLLCVALGGAPAESSIEKEPVRVTHRNSGPRYDIDEVERTRLNADSSENQVIPSGPRGDPSVDAPSSEAKPPAERPSGAAAGEEGATSGEQEPIGHISIRRIFLIPMSNPDWRPAQEGDSGRQQPGEQPEEANPLASLFGAAPSQHHRAAAPSFWPFLLRPSYHEQEQQQQQQTHGHRHLFGADEASRPPPADAVASSESNEQASAPPRSGEREVDSALVDPRERPQRPQKPLLDPIQMMIEMMQQALNPSPMGPMGAGANDGLGPNLFSDLNREASSGGAPRAGAGEESRFGADKPAGGELEQASRPQLGKRNETREDVVEIDGKKYLRRTVTNKHVGDNIIFMTKRLIFTPLNETTAGGEQAPPAAPATPAAGPSADEQPSIPSVGPLFVPTTAGNADVLPDIIKEEPERRKVDKVEGSPVEPANASAASPAAPSATPETTSVSSSETKPSNSETPAPVAAEPAPTTEAPLSTTQAAATSPEETTQKSFVERVSSARAAERLIDQERPTPSSSTNMKPL